VIDMTTTGSTGDEMGDRTLPRWRELSTPDEIVDAICELYARRGDAMYDEAVSQSMHGVQSAWWGEQEGASPSLVAAALLHDLAHLLERDPADGDEHPDRDLRHEEVGARFLANWFGPEVTEPIRHHVAAKRFLCAVEPEYLATLSPASVHSLGLQGGPMSPDEAAAFLDLPGAAEAIRLRRWDDLAKDPERPTAPFSHYRDLLIDLVATGR
jgi:gamma-butyrobetaine dioxygenase